MTVNTYELLSQERKMLQEQGLCPEWMSTGGWQMFKSKYLYQAANPREQFERIARTAAKHAPKSTPEHWELGRTWETSFLDILWKGLLAGSTPVISNTGTKRGLSVSCAGSVAEDSVLGFYDAYREVACLTKEGFGTATDLSGIRARGSNISRGGKAAGIVPVFEHFVQDMNDVSQGSNRRGGWAGYVDIEHGDFYELAQKIELSPDGRNVGWIIKDVFIAKLNKGDKEAVARFQYALKLKMLTGRGYFFFVDKANRHVPQAYKNHNLDIKASQLCVAPETEILTRSGYKCIKDLVDTQVDIWNGQEWSSVVVKKTGVNQKLITVKTKDGFELTCTPEHKFYKVTRKHGGGTNKVHELPAKNLMKGDKLIKFNLPIIQGEKVLYHAYANGFYSGDGCIVGDKQRLYFYGEKEALKEHCGDIFFDIYVQPNQKRTYAHTRLLKDKFFVPDCSYSIQSRMEWLAGLLDSDGCVVRNGNTQGYQVASVEPEFLRAILKMLQTCGVKAKVTHNRDAGFFELPANDGSGELKLFECRSVDRLLIGNDGLSRLAELGLKTYRLETTSHKPNRECSQFIKVSEVVDEGRYDDTYCFTEHKRHMGVFNGILTGQCNEIVLHSSEEYTYTCILSWMNLSKWREIEGTDAVFVATVFLDCIVSDFIENASTIKGLEKAVASTKKGRPIALGVGGYHTLFQQEGLPFGSFEAHMLSNQIFKHINDESLRASKWLAQELGSPDWCVETGERFTHRMACAPTKSTALIYGGISEGINPDVAMSFTQLTSAGEIDRVNPTLLKLIKEKGLDVEKCIKETVISQGSVQTVNWLTDHEKDVFKTAFEISQRDILRLAAARQKNIDQGQSLNLFFSGDAEESYIAEIHQEAFLNEDILGLYYVYSSRGVVSSSGECSACQ